jgi:hypothetical protein
MIGALKVCPGQRTKDVVQRSLGIKTPYKDNITNSKHYQLDVTGKKDSV